MELSTNDIKLAILSSTSESNIYDAEPSPSQPLLREKDNTKLKRGLTSEEIYIWANEKFLGKECVVYIPSNMDQNICKCGRPISTHFGQRNANDVADGKKKEVDEWDSTIHTRRVDTASYGGLKFALGDVDTTDGTVNKVNNPNVRKYLRLPDDITVNDGLCWMKQIWKLKRPKLVLSFHGGHENFNIPSQLRSRFDSCLIEILQTVDTWFFTDGTNVGLSELIGSIFSTHQISSKKKGACVGMASWGAIDLQMKLSNDSKGSSVQYNAPDKTVPDRIRANYLDKNHSHFLLVDDGSYGIHGRANEMRTKLFELLGSEEADQNVPVVLVLAEGGLPIVNDIYNGLTSTPKTPVVVVRNSGRLADVFVKLLEHQEVKHHLPLQLRGEMVQNLIQKLLHDKIKNLDQYKDTLDAYVEKIKICIEEHNKCIIIYDHDEGSGALQKSILRAYKALHPDTHDEHLRINELEILWEKVDMAKLWKIDKNHKNKMFKKALLHNRVESVKLLLESGINLRMFLEQHPIKKLYMKAWCRDSSVLSQLMTHDEIEETERNTKHNFEMQIIHRIAMEITNEYYSAENMKSTNNPLQVLLLWTFFANQPGMGRCLFNFCTNSPMVTALVMSRIYKYISKMKRFEGEMEENANTEKLYFAHFAVDLLSLYSKTNENLARDCLTMTHPLWGYKDAMLLGVNMMFQKFIAQQLVQKILTNIWRGLHKESEEGVQQLRIDEQQRNINCSSQELHPLISNEEKNVKYKQPIRCERIKGQNLNPKKPQKLWRTTLSRIIDILLYVFLVPHGKFCLNLFIYLIFVGLFSYVVVSKISSIDHSYEEYFICGMVFTYFLDEIRQIAIVKKTTESQMFRNWTKSIWNVLDALSIILFAFGFSLRYFSETLTSGRVIYAIDIVIWYLKIFQFYRVSGTLGPYVVMIWRM